MVGQVVGGNPVPGKVCGGGGGGKAGRQVAGKGGGREGVGKVVKIV